MIDEEMHQRKQDDLLIKSLKSINRAKSAARAGGRMALAQSQNNIGLGLAQDDSKNEAMAKSMVLMQQSLELEQMRRQLEEAKQAMNEIEQMMSKQDTLDQENDLSRNLKPLD